MDQLQFSGKYLFKNITTPGKEEYTANIITVKSTGFTYVRFSMVVPLSFWQLLTTGRETLYFNCRPISTTVSKALDTSYLKIALYYCHLRLNVGAVK